MYSHKPINLYKHLKLQKTKGSSKYARLFYLSWKDALWDLCAKHKLKPGSVVLTPSWYCRDVENNITTHGYQVRHYKVNKIYNPYFVH